MKRQAASPMVSLNNILNALGTLGLQQHAEAVAGHLIDNGFEEMVPIGGLVKLLRDAGLPPTRALAVKNLLVEGSATPLVLIHCRVLPCWCICT